MRKSNVSTLEHLMATVGFITFGNGGIREFSVEGRISQRGSLKQKEENHSSSE